MTTWPILEKTKSDLSGNEAKHLSRKDEFSLIGFIQLKMSSLARGLVCYVQQGAGWRGSG
eukprot:3939537-Rhodomonas_salina.6